MTVLALGEVMLRLDPGPGRIRNARAFEVHIGGGEFNVAAGLASFGHAAAIATALPESEVGELVVAHIRAASVGTHHIRWVADDGLGGRARVGINFTERGFGPRAPLGVSDRAGSAAARMAPGDIDWDDVFAGGEVSWLHTGGVFTALSPQTAELALEAVTAAREHGVPVSFDVNFRPSLQRAIANPPRHTATTARILSHVDVLFSNEPEYLLAIGEPPRADAASGEERFARMVEDVRERFPRLGVAAATRRSVVSATRNGWGGLAWSPATGTLASPGGPDIEILDRVGGGDAFAAGIVHGLMTGAPLERALGLGVAHGALVMATPGDLSTATLAEVEALAAGGELRTRR